MQIQVSMQIMKFSKSKIQMSCILETENTVNSICYF